MTRFSDEMWVQSLPLITEPVVRQVPTIIEPSAFLTKTRRTECAQCGNMFTPKRSTGKYCDAVCRRRAWNGKEE